MSWSGISSNQTVSYTNLKDAVSQHYFLEKNTIPVSNRQMTRSEVEYYVVVDTDKLNALGVSSNQLPVKSDLSGYVEISISNISLDLSIDSVSVNGITPYGLSLPCGAGQNTTGRIFFFGIATIAVTWGGTISGQHVTLVDSDSTSNCFNYPVDTSAYITSFAVNGNSPVSILAADGSCS